MRLEGTLDAFSLPDIFSLLSATRKTGALHLTRSGAGDGAPQGVVHLRDGAVCGASSDTRRQALGRRLVGGGHVDDAALSAAVAAVAGGEAPSLARALLGSGDVEPALLASLAAASASDAVFELMRWPDGEFSFVVDEPDPDGLDVALPVDLVVSQARSRLEEWASVEGGVPDPDSVVSVVLTPGGALAVDADEWALLALVDGRRTLAELVALSGRGDHAVVTALGGLLARGLVRVDQPGQESDGVAALLRRQGLLASLETVPGDEPVPDATTLPGSASPAVVPARPEPFSLVRRPEHPDGRPVETAAAAGRPELWSVGSAALAADSEDVEGGAGAPGPDDSAPGPLGLLERDPAINRSLLLRLIAGVRGL